MCQFNTIVIVIDIGRIYNYMLLIIFICYFCRVSVSWPLIHPSLHQTLKAALGTLLTPQET